MSWSSPGRPAATPSAALECARRALEINPLSPEIVCNFDTGLVLAALHQSEAAMEAFDEVDFDAPDFEM